MIVIDEYVMPDSVPEAFALLQGRTDAAIIGGGVFTRLTAKKIGLAVDLSRTGLDYVRQTASGVEIGAMSSLRTLETNPLLLQLAGGIVARTAGQIAGVQLRNLATVGGTVCGRYAFSDLIPVLLVLGSSVQLHQAGERSLAEFLDTRRPGRDILTAVIIPRTVSRASCQNFRLTAASLPILTVAAARTVTGWQIAVGARPGPAVLAWTAMAALNEPEPGGMPAAAAADPVGRTELASTAASRAAADLSFGDDRRASAVYRTQLCQVLVRRAILEVGE